MGSSFARRRGQRCQSRRGVLAAGLGLLGASLLPRLVAAEAGDDIVWGGALPLSGAFSAVGEDGKRGLSTYVDYLNASGGIAGRRVRIEVHDSAYMPDRAIAAFKSSVAAKPGAVAFLGDSAGFAHMVAPELKNGPGALVASTAFTSAIVDRASYPLQFVPGPTYADMIRLLLTYLAEARPAGGSDYRVAMVHSNTEFGRDPLAAAEQTAKSLGLTLASVIETKVAGANTRDVLVDLIKAKPDAVIFHGYVSSVWPEIIRAGVERGLETLYLGTYWAMDPAVLLGLGRAADRYFGVMPFRYWWEQAESAMLTTMARLSGSPNESSHFVQAWLVGMIFAEAIRRTLDAGKALEGSNLKAALDRLEDWDSGGLIGLPVSVVDNRIPIGRIYRGNPKAKRFEPVSEWRQLS